MNSIAERLRRKPEQYAGASPKAIAAGSTAQMMYFVEDAQADIATLSGEIDRLTRERDAMRDALEQAQIYVEKDECAHGRQFGTGNVIRSALNTAAQAQGGGR